MPGFFGASPDEYVAIFTPNAAGGLRLVGEGYPFQPGDRFLLTFDNHNSVNGIREFARARGAETTYVPSEIPELRVDEQLLTRDLTEVAGEHHNLCACLVQSNFSGVQHPLEWIEQAHDRGWDVLLDAAAYVPTKRLVAGSQVRGVGCPCARSRPASLPRSARLLDRGHDRPVLADRQRCSLHQPKRSAFREAPGIQIVVNR